MRPSSGHLFDSAFGVGLPDVRTDKGRAAGTLRWALSLLCLATCVLPASCGGAKASEASSPEPTTASTEAPESQPDAEPPAPEKPAPRCEDGSCFECGEGLCPQGFYCDKDASGGPACSWVPDCAKKATCACIQRALGKSCSCDDAAGGPAVSCQ